MRERPVGVASGPYLTGLVTFVAATLLALTGCAPGTTSEDPADVELYLQSRLDSAWQETTGRTTDRPSTAAVQLVLPDGWPYVMNRCMVESGFDGYSYEPKAGFSNAGAGRSAMGAEGLAWYRCSVSFPEIGDNDTPVSTTELDGLYEYYTAIVEPCLLIAGSPAAEAPTREEFLDGGEGQPGAWNPYLSIALPASSSIVDALLHRCAPYPASQRDTPVGRS